MTLTGALVAVFRVFEKPSGAREPSAPRAWAGPAAALGVTFCLFAVLGLSAVGFGGLLQGRTALLIAVHVTAPAAVVMTLSGWLLVERAGRGRVRPSDPFRRSPTAFLPMPMPDADHTPTRYEE